MFFIKISFTKVKKLKIVSFLYKFKFNKNNGFFLLNNNLQKLLLPSINLIIVLNLKPKKYVGYITLDLTPKLIIGNAVAKYCFLNLTFNNGNSVFKLVPNIIHKSVLLKAFTLELNK